VHIRSANTTVIVTAAIFVIFHLVVVVLPLALSGGSGEAQAFATAVFDLPIFWLLGLFPEGRAVLYGSSPSTYVLVFSLGGTLAYAAVGALLGWGIHAARRGMHAA